MIFNVTGMTEKDYLRSPFWLFLPSRAGDRPIILGVSDRSDERIDYQMLCTKFGQQYQFLLMNDDAAQACDAAQINLQMLGSIEYDDLAAEPIVLLGYRPTRKL